MIAHVEINSGFPWVNEFFGHPHEYWPLYLLISIVLSTLVYLLIVVYRIERKP